MSDYEDIDDMDLDQMRQEEGYLLEEIEQDEAVNLPDIKERLRENKERYRYLAEKIIDADDDISDEEATRLLGI